MPATNEKQDDLDDAAQNLGHLNAAAQELATEYYWLAEAMAVKYAGRKSSVTADQVSDAMLALCLAARDFDPDTKVPFRAYAATRIWRALIDLTCRDKRRARSLVANGYKPVTLRIGVDPNPADGLDIDPEEGGSAVARSEDLSGSSLDFLRTAWPLGHRILCLCYGLDGFPAVPRDGIATELGISRGYVDSIHWWSIREIRRYLGVVGSRARS
jgi:RNA polymerase sigma factor (sigma-70 family)